MARQRSVRAMSGIKRNDDREDETGFERLGARNGEVALD